MLIVNYHAIEPERSPVSCTLDDLRADIHGLRDAGFVFVSLDDCADWLAGRRGMPARAAAITFDDGYASVGSRAFPFLAAQAVPSTVFVIAGRIGGDNRWPGQWSSVPTLRLLDQKALQEMAAAGVNLGAHTFTHPALPTLDDRAARREIIDAAAALEDAFGVKVRHFAYPYGFRGTRDVDIARQRYELSLSAHPALVEREAENADVPRVDCHDVRVALRLGVVAGAATAPYLRVRRGLRWLRRSLSAPG